MTRPLLIFGGDDLFVAERPGTDFFVPRLTGARHAYIIDGMEKNMRRGALWGG